MRVIRCPLSVAVVLVASCSDSGVLRPDDEPLPPAGVVVSDPVPNRSGTIVSHAGASVSAADNVAYVSLAPNTVDQAASAQILNRRIPAAAVLVPIVNGGFDPVPIEAAAGDSIEVTPLAAGAPMASIVVKVPVRRPPTIVRGKPPKGRTDVALNVIITVIFTEPVQPGTITPETMRVFRDGLPVRGDVELRADQLEASFKPEQPLDPFATYTIQVSRGVRDVDGDALEFVFESTFETGARACDPVEGLPCGGDIPGGVQGSVVAISPASRGPAVGAAVHAWVIRPDGTGYLSPQARTDTLGRFALYVPVGSKLFVRAVMPGFDQPCGSTVELNDAQAFLDVELVRAPMSTASRGRTLSGYALEMVPDPERNGLPLLAIPVSGVKLYLEAPRGFVAMTTTTDAKGAYRFCNLPELPGTSMTAIAAGFLPREVLVPHAWTSIGLDVFMTRAP